MIKSQKYKVKLECPCIYICTGEIEIEAENMSQALYKAFHSDPNKVHWSEGSKQYQHIQTKNLELMEEV